MEESLDVWFKREILVHEQALVRFIRRRWLRNAEEVIDLRQETYARVLEAAGVSRPTAPRSFLFATAKHLISDRIRRQRVVSIDTVGDLETLNVVTDDVSPERQNVARQELRMLARAFDSLPPKCREIVWLRRVEQLSQREVASRLQIAHKTVEGHLTKGLKRLADALFSSEYNDCGDVSTQGTQRQHPHGKRQAD